MHSEPMSAFYSNLLTLIDENPRFLANSECVQEKNLFPRAMNPNSPHRVLYEVVPNPDSPSLPGVEREFIAYVVGQAGAYSDGHRVGALGSVADDVIIDDTTHVKLHFATKAAGGCLPELENVWKDQCVGLQEVTAALVGGWEKYSELQCDPKILLRPMLKFNMGTTFNSNTSQGRMRNEVIHIVSEDFYTTKFPVKGSVPAKTAAPARSNRKRKSTNTEGTLTRNDGAPVVTQAASTDAAAFQTEDIKLTSRYDPRCLPDHVGDRFAHTEAQVLQFDIRDETNALVPPWKYRAVLRPGTIFFAAVGFRLWEMSPRGNMTRTSLTFQLALKTIKVLRQSDRAEDASDLEPTPATAPAQSSRVPDDVAKDFDAFCLELEVAHSPPGEKDVHMPDVNPSEPSGSTSTKAKKKRLTYSYFML
ncbi:hypothetical protein BV25DRAFT_1901810 [Artomyces pyxidatus]|uniref:Uncharacterized protein n=1 Tax=Artomyces pyxidatus TaxID=48021 RepID=A0ACB8ST72_9AGAM|nr:hypothetical protein BV25DRAFT_1901810 [Artomyces pyxidatus]